MKVTFTPLDPKPARPANIHNGVEYEAVIDGVKCVCINDAGWVWTVDADGKPRRPPALHHESATMSLDAYSTDELRSLADRLRHLQQVNPIATMSVSEVCGHPRRNGFPACRVCIEQEIERRERQ